MRTLKDRDFLKTIEGFLFCVVGYSHPRNRIISYLKYMPNREGKWGKAGQYYSRTMQNYTIPNLLANIEFLQKEYPLYVFYSRIFNTRMSAIPTTRIAQSYFPDEKLQVLMKAKDLDPLEEKTVDFVSFLSRESGISKDYFGVTGSILTDIHNPHFSDMDIVVYGASNAWTVKKVITQTNSEIFQNRYSGKHQSKMLTNFIENYPFTRLEAQTIFEHRWNYGYFKKIRYSIHAVRKEPLKKYGEEHFFPQGIVEGKAEIVGINDSLFLPCTYQVKGFEVRLGNIAVEVNEIVSYDGLYSGLFNLGESILVKGKLEKVVDAQGSCSFRVLVGSLEAQGQDYIKTR